MDALRVSIVAAVVAILGVAMAVRAGDAESLTFERDVRPIFKAYCLDCHGGGAELEGPARPAPEAVRRTRGRERAGGGRGQPDESLLIERIKRRRDAAGREEGARRTRSP